MRKQLLLFISLLLVLAALGAVMVAAAPSAQAQGPEFKHLAGPASDIRAGIMQLPDPARLGVRSHSAMLPVHLEKQGRTFQWQMEIPLDVAQGLSFALIAPQAQEWQIEVQKVGTRSRFISLEKSRGLKTEKQLEAFGYDGLSFPAVVYHVAAMPAGAWRVRISAPQAGDGYLVVGAESPYRLYAHLADYNLTVGEQIGLQAYIYDARQKTKDAPTPLTGVARTLSIRLVQPNGEEQTIEMFDDGAHQDGAAGDGVFGGFFVAQASGLYKAQVMAQGVTPAGAEFMRTTQHIFPVINQHAKLGSSASMAIADDVRLDIELPVAGLEEGTLVRAYAEVWGIDAAGNPAPAAWVSGLSQVQNGHINLSFDTRWLSYSQVKPPLELRQVRLQDNATSIPLATAPRMSLPLLALPKAPTTPVTKINEEMLMGPRPSQENLPLAATASGGKLMLVHGYCSEGVWPTSDFTDYTVFQDYNQNRTHDEFARLIRDFGAQYPSFGVVAHSQGGAASVHLYTYYWSGFDYSSGDRLIQSVGTPYQGTALAGNLALLGEIFGAGCGPNWDLTYDGASLWLSGIPSWARSRVHYWTTSDEDVWWRWDYCSAATDIILDDPEDGVVERWAGQLSGATNHGHKEGWCHTNDMRDPAQYLDHNRNYEMNYYGNR